MANSSKLIRLPARGRLLVAADLHGNLRDFLTVAARFESMGDDGHLLFLGDLLHGPYLSETEWSEGAGPPGRLYRDQSPAIILQLSLLQERYPGRVFALLGNHEHAHVGGPRTSVFARDEAAALEQRLGVETTIWLNSYLKSWPLWALAPCGLLFSHAAPGAEPAQLAELENIDYRRYHSSHVSGAADAAKPEPGRRAPGRGKPPDAASRLLGQLLWAPALPPYKAQALLSQLEANVAVYGHTPVEVGHETIGYEQLILSSSFAMADERKRVLELDLAATYRTVEDLRPGHEISPLY